MMRRARAFVDAYLTDPDERVHPDQWRDRLRPLVTPALWRGLRNTRPGVTPSGPYILQPQIGGAFAAIVHVELESGPTLRLELVTYEDSWRVATVGPAP